MRLGAQLRCPPYNTVQSSLIYLALLSQLWALRPTENAELLPVQRLCTYATSERATVQYIRVV